MAVTLDPTQPTDSSSPTLGASDIRTLTGEVQQMFGGGGTAPIIYTVAPFSVDATTGLVTVPGNAVTALGIATLQQVQASASVFSGIASGTNTLTVTLAPVPASYAAIAGLPALVRIPNANTGPVTINYNSLGAVAVVKNGNQALVGGELIAGAWYVLVYDSTNTNIQLVGVIDAVLTKAYKPTDQTVTSSTTLVNDNDLFFAIAANEVWQFEIDLYATFDGVSASGIKGAFTVPSGCTLQWVVSSFPTAIATSSGSSEVIASGGGSQTMWMGKLIGQALNGSTAGTVQFQWAQNTSNATGTKAKAGSSLIANRLDP